MKKLLLSVLASAALFACSDAKKEETASAVEHIYKPTYSDNWKIGDQKNVLIAEQIHKDLFAKDFAKVEAVLSDTAVFNNEDGSVLKGKVAVIDFMKKNFSAIKINNYKIIAIFPTVGENGHQWVDIWDQADVELPDGTVQKLVWMDAFRFENGKVVGFTGFVKPRNE
jgi:predicted SnoaL-like aldol condensation-catalyzing enzyme